MKRLNKVIRGVTGWVEKLERQPVAFPIIYQPKIKYHDRTDKSDE